MKDDTKKAKLMLVFAMVMFATIGIFRRYIPLPSAMLASSRGFIGGIFLVVFMHIRGIKPSVEDIKRNFGLLVLTGAFIGINWILLFEAYRFTTVAAATLCYYMAPIFVVAVSPIFLNEALTKKKVLCIGAALVGMVLVSGVLKAGLGELKGIFFGLGAALFYASVIILNKRIKNISAYDKTTVQLFAAAIVVLPYALGVESLEGLVISPLAVAMVILVGVLHTGVAYAMYFGSLTELKSQTIALFSYIDPVGAVILSALLLGESMGLMEIAGAVLILSAAIASEL